MERTCDTCEYRDFVDCELLCKCDYMWRLQKEQERKHKAEIIVKIWVIYHLYEEEMKEQEYQKFCKQLEQEEFNPKDFDPVDVLEWLWKMQE